MVMIIKDAARMIEYHGSGSYIYRNVIIECTNNITYLSYRSESNPNIRTVTNKYTLSIKDNVFEKGDLRVIFSNIDYLIGIIKKRIFALFSNSDYEGIEDSFEVLFNEEDKQLIVSFEYEIEDSLTPDHKNVMVCEFIIGTLLDGAAELQEPDEKTLSELKILNEDGIAQRAPFGTNIRIN